MNHPNEGFVITIDGPAGAGKSTIAKCIAKKLGYLYINTGDIYRYVTYRALREKEDVRDAKKMDILSKKIVKQCQKLNHNKSMKGISKIPYTDENNILAHIHSPRVNKNVSIVAQHPSVRKNLISFQRLLAKQDNIVMEGRDIGSVILPDADIKLFFTASEYTRVMRRYKELLKAGYRITYQEVKEEMLGRDSIDRQREIAPLVKPEDAIMIDTSDKDIDEVVRTVLEIIKKKIDRKG